MKIKLPAVMMVMACAVLAGAVVAKAGLFTDSSKTFPAIVWKLVLPEPISGIDMAEETGHAVVGTESKLIYMKDGPGPEWTAGPGKGWKYLRDPAVSRDGTRVFFQTDDKRKKTTEKLDLTVRMHDGQGNELWARPNPYKNKFATLSPEGGYIAFGEPIHQGVWIHDSKMEKLWGNEHMQYWSIAFDAEDKYFFDGQGGILYTVEGKQVWDFGPRTRVLSVSDNAEYILTSYYITLKTGTTMFLMGRLDLKKIVLKGTGGRVSPDGSLTAYVNGEGELAVYNTAELLGMGPDKLRPLYKRPFKRPWYMNIGRDNRTLFVLGEEDEKSSAMLFIDLEAREERWREPVGDQVKVADARDDNSEVLVRTGA